MRAILALAALFLLSAVPVGHATFICESGACVWDHSSGGRGDCTSENSYDANGVFTYTSAARAGVDDECWHTVNRTSNTDVRATGLFVYGVTPAGAVWVGWYSQSGTFEGQDVTPCVMYATVNGSGYWVPCPDNQGPPRVADLP